MTWEEWRDYRIDLRQRVADYLTQVAHLTSLYCSNEEFEERINRAFQIQASAEFQETVIGNPKE